MKKIALVLVLLTGLQLKAEEPTFFSSNEVSSNEIGVVLDPDEPMDGAPIDEYFYVLGAVAIGIAMYRIRIKKIVKN